MEKRSTIQRQLVLDSVMDLGCHATAEDVYNNIHKTHSSISRGTVYRNLSILAEEGRILKIDVPDEAARYDHLCDKHYHIRCEKCGRVCDVDMDVIPDLDERVRDTHGFIFLDYDIFFRGICPQCKEV